MRFIRRNILLLACLSPLLMLAQNQVGINTTNPDASAVLHIESTTKGVRFARMSQGQRRNISSPENGLLVFDNNTDTFWYYSNGNWTEIVSNSAIPDGISDVDTDNRIFLEFTNNNNQVRIYQHGTEFFRMATGRFEQRNTGNSIFIGQNTGLNDDYTSNNNVFIGTNVGQSNTTGRRNTALGYLSMQNNVAQGDNLTIGDRAGLGYEDVRRTVAIGGGTLLVNDSADNHTVIGHQILASHTTNADNIALGNRALQNSLTSRFNVAMGTEALRNCTAGAFNVAVGHRAGVSATGQDGVFIGYEAGANETNNDRLYIENSSSSTPLIFGNFSSNDLTINGDLHVTGNITYVGTISDVSDRRLKEDIKPLQNVLSGIEGLQAYRYHLKADVNKTKEYGLVAQEVQANFPLAVRTIDTDKGYLGVSYIQLIPITLQGLNEQFQQLKNSEKGISTLNQETDELSERIQKLKERLSAQAALSN